MSQIEINIKSKKRYRKQHLTSVILTLLLSFFFFPIVTEAQDSDQKIGIVLSGGGATAAAHIGFLKALEDNHIPIDYITGSSMGAIIGAFYASGYSIDQIEELVLSKGFQTMSTGELPDSLSFYLRESDLDASLINLKLNPSAIMQSTLPTHLVDPAYMDYKFMEFFGPASAAANYDFDQLFVPYRAVASDIEANKSVIFRSGELNLAARASGTYPFYMKPLTINGKLLFDGGLYNNYPADILYEEFLPDVILGCNVSQNVEAPKEDDLMSQLVNMIQYRTDFDNVCEDMITITPDIEISTFDFSRVEEAINSGYVSTLKRMDSIRLIVDNRISKEQIEQKRKTFASKHKPILIKEIKVEGLPESQGQAIIKNLLQRETYITIPEFQKRFFRLYADEKVRYTYPTIKLDPLDNKYIATVHVKPEKKLELGFGGHFSSRPLNMGFVQIKYHIRGRNNLSLMANSYFGKFYSSTKAGLKLDLNFKNPMMLEANYTYNAWDYFNSFATFLEEVKPSFIVKHEEIIAAKLSLPVANRGRFELGGKYARLFDDYYQTDDFLNTDTADQTTFKTLIIRTSYERSTLNRKQFSDRGTFFKFSVNYLNGKENTIPGSTSEIRDTTSAFHQWTVLKAKYKNYFFHKKRITCGFDIETGWSANQPRFTNYRATLIRSLAFEPIPESKSFFIDQYRSNFYSSAGLMLSYNISNNFQVRTDNYLYRPWERIFATLEDESNFEPTSEIFYVGSGSLIYHSPIGPLRLSVNYYDRKATPWSVLFNFGYFIFNDGYLD